MKYQKIHLYIQIALFVIWFLILPFDIIAFGAFTMVIGAVQVIHAIALLLLLKNSLNKNLLVNYFIGLGSFIVCFLLSGFLSPFSLVCVVIAAVLAFYFFYITVKVFQTPNEPLDNLDDFLRPDNTRE